MTYKEKFISKAVKGVIEYSLEDLFSEIARISSEDHSTEFTVKCSYLEIYNEHVCDLLKDSCSMAKEYLEVCESKDKGFYVKGLTQITVNNYDEALSYLAYGENNRRYAATVMNHHSSRSHVIF